MAFLLNEDFENFAAHRPLNELNEYGIKKQVDLYSSGGSNILIFNGNGQKAVFDSKVFDPLWKDLDVKEGDNVFSFVGADNTLLWCEVDFDEA